MDRYACSCRRIHSRHCDLFSSLPSFLSTLIFPLRYHHLIVQGTSALDPFSQTVDIASQIPAMYRIFVKVSPFALAGLFRVRGKYARVVKVYVLRRQPTVRTSTMVDCSLSRRVRQYLAGHRAESFNIIWRLDAEETFSLRQIRMNEKVPETVLSFSCLSRFSARISALPGTFVRGFASFISFATSSSNIIPPI